MNTGTMILPPIFGASSGNAAEGSELARCADFGQSNARPASVLPPISLAQPSVGTSTTHSSIFDLLIHRDAVVKAINSDTCAHKSNFDDGQRLPGIRSLFPNCPSPEFSPASQRPDTLAHRVSRGSSPAPQSASRSPTPSNSSSGSQRSRSTVRCPLSSEEKEDYEDSDDDLGDAGIAHPVYTGVSKSGLNGRWRAQLSTRGKTIHLGTFASAEDAAKAWDRAAVQERGKEGAKTNFDISDYVDQDGRIKDECLSQDGQRSVRRLRNRQCYRGVYQSGTFGRWKARIVVNGQKIHLGTFATAEEAARAWDRKAVEYRGAHTPTNFGRSPAAAEAHHDLHRSSQSTAAAAAASAAGRAKHTTPRDMILNATAAAGAKDRRGGISSSSSPAAAAAAAAAASSPSVTAYAQPPAAAAASAYLASLAANLRPPAACAAAADACRGVWDDSAMFAPARHCTPPAAPSPCSAPTEHWLKPAPAAPAAGAQFSPAGRPGGFLSALVNHQPWAAALLPPKRSREEEPESWPARPAKSMCTWPPRDAAPATAGAGRQHLSEPWMIAAAAQQGGWMHGRAGRS